MKVWVAYNEYAGQFVGAYKSYEQASDASADAYWYRKCDLLLPTSVEDYVITEFEVRHDTEKVYALSTRDKSHFGTLRVSSVFDSRIEAENFMEREMEFARVTGSTRWDYEVVELFVIRHNL